MSDSAEADEVGADDAVAAGDEVGEHVAVEVAPVGLTVEAEDRRAGALVEVMHAQPIDLEVVRLERIPREVLEAIVGRAEDLGHLGSSVGFGRGRRHVIASVGDPSGGSRAGSVAGMWIQREITLQERPRGFHLVSGEVLAALPELTGMSVGVLHLLLLHTSAALTLNENASPEVRDDLEAWFDRAVPERSDLWTHTLEGDDDMPAHVKASLLGASITLPVGGGRPLLGTWQGIYLCEHRDRGGSRRLVATAWGE